MEKKERGLIDPIYLQPVKDSYFVVEGFLEYYTQINFHQAMSSHVTHLCNYFWWEC